MATHILLAASCGVTAGVLIYDARRALAPRLPGERRWRAGRAVATVVAVLGLVLLLHSSGPLWVRRSELVGFVLACGLVLRCSVPLKRLVADAVQKRRQVETAW